MGVGYGPAALPLWVELLARLFRYRTALEAVLPCDEMSAHLYQLSQLYEAAGPPLAQAYSLLAPLDPSALPGTHSPIHAPLPCGTLFQITLDRVP